MPAGLSDSRCTGSPFSRSSAAAVAFPAPRRETLHGGRRTATCRPRSRNRCLSIFVSWLRCTLAATTGELLARDRSRNGRSISRSREMVACRVAVFVLTTAIAAIPTADAEDAIKPGNWEYSATAPGVKLPRGTQPSPDIRVGPERVTVTKTKGITAADPLPPPMHDFSGKHCTMDKSEVTGGTLSWLVTCTTPKIPFGKIGPCVTAPRRWMDNLRFAVQFLTGRRSKNTPA